MEKANVKTEEDLEEYLKDKSRDYLIGMIKGFWSLNNKKKVNHNNG